MNSNAIIYESNDSLQHYGVLGMRWGHRKSYSDKVRSRIDRELHTSNVRTKAKRQEIVRKVLTDENKKLQTKSDKRIGKANLISKSTSAAYVGYLLFSPYYIPFAQTAAIAGTIGVKGAAYVKDVMDNKKFNQLDEIYKEYSR